MRHESYRFIRPSRVGTGMVLGAASGASAGAIAKLSLAKRASLAAGGAVVDAAAGAGAKVPLFEALRQTIEREFPGWHIVGVRRAGRLSAEVLVKGPSGAWRVARDLEPDVRDADDALYDKFMRQVTRLVLEYPQRAR